MNTKSSRQLELSFPRRKRVARIARSKTLLPPHESLATRRRSRVPHETRPEVSGPIHVVWRIRRGLPSLRTPRGLRRLERAFRKSKEQRGFLLVHYSIQQDHLHLMVEVKDRRKLSRGLQALGIRIAKSLNSLWHRTRGNVFAERYFDLALKGWKNIRNAVRYILNNGRKHGSWTVKGRPDPFSSGRWYFTRRDDEPSRPLRSSPVMRSLVPYYLPLISVDDVPGPTRQMWAEDLSLDAVIR
jgi:REP element-mobilizing transposase RayT